MKLTLQGCRAYIARRQIPDYNHFAAELGVEVEVLKLFENGARIGYDAVRDIYNNLGEEVVREIIDFEEETMNGFKSKYVLVGKTRY